MAGSVNRRINIWINDKEVENNMRSVRAAFRKANIELNSMTRGTKEYYAQVAKIRQLKAIMDDHRNKLGGINRQWENFKTIFLSTFSGNIAAGILQRAASALPNMARGAAKVSDELAGIQKTAGLSKEEVEALNAELSKIDTRTSKSDLRGIAERAGQAGIDKEQLLGYVTALDKVNVSLGKDFGGADEVADKLGKIRNVLIDIKSEDPGADVLNIANALNKLSAEGNATAPVMADLSSRIGGLGIPLGLSSGEVIGMSAALQELNVTAERGGTAVTRILQRMTQKTDEFARIAGMSTKEFNRLVNENLFEALLKVVEGSQKSASSATEFAVILEDLQLTGSGASEVFAKLGTSTDFLREKVASATVGLTNQNSILQEFTLNNENLAGELDKLGKNIQSIFTSSTVKQWFTDAVILAREFTEWIKENSEEIKTLLKVLVRAGGVWLLYKGYVAATNTVLAQQIIRTKFLIDRYNRMNAIVPSMAKRATTAQALWAMSTNRLTKATKALSLAISANPVGAITKGVMAIVSGIMMALPLLDLFEKKVEKVVKLSDIIANAGTSQGTVDQNKVNQANNLLQKLVDQNLTRAQGIKLLKEFNDLTGANVQWTDNLSMRVKALSNAHREYNEQLKEQAKINAIQSDIDMLKNQEKKLQTQADTVFGKMMTGQLGGKGALNWYNALIKGIEDVRNKIKSLEVAKAFKENQIQTAQAVNAASTATKQAIDESAEALAGLQQKLIESLNSFNQDFSKALQKTEEENQTADRNKKYASLFGFDLDVEKLRDKFRDLREATKTSFNEAFVNAKNQQTELNKLNDKLLADNIISKKQHADEKQKIEDAYLAWEQRAAQAQNEALYNLNSAYLTELDLLKQKHREQSIADEIEAIEKLNQAELKYTSRRISRVEEVNRAYAAQQKELAQLAEELLRLENPDVQFISQEDIENKIAELQEQLDEETFFIRLQARVEDITDYYNPAMDAANAYYDFLAQKEANHLQNVEQAANKEMNILEQKLRSNTITEEQYNAKRKDLEEKIRAEEQEIAVKQWRRNKILAYSEALMNAALATTKALASMPPPGNFIVAGLVGLKAGLQVATIAQQQPPKFRKGGRLEGPSHENGGIPVVYRPTGQQIAEAEGGEVFYSKETDRNNKPVTDILLDASMNKGGANVMGQIARAVLPQINYAQSIASTQMATGARISTGNQTSTQAQFSQNESRSDNMAAYTQAIKENTMEVKAMHESIKAWPKKLKSYVILKELQEATDDLEQIEFLASFDQRTNRLNV